MVTPKMIKILVVDDHAVVRSGIREFLSSVVNFDVVAEAANGAEALAIIGSTTLDVVLLDMSLPDINGLEVLKIIRKQCCNLPVLMFSSYPEDELATHAYDLGVSGYLNKAGPPSEILLAINTVAAGSRYISPTYAERLLSETSCCEKKLDYMALSRREIEVLLHLSRGTSLTKIAEQLNLSVKTIGTYRTRVLEKLDLHSNAELTRYVIENKLGEEQLSF